MSAKAKAFLESIALYAAPPVGAKALAQDRPIMLAIVDPAYTGSGPAKVTFDGEAVMSSKAYVVAVAVAPGSRVYLLPVGKSYLIAGTISSLRLPFMHQVPILPQNGWYLYSDHSTNDRPSQYGAGRFPAGTAEAMASSAYSGFVYATMTSTGIVSLQGLMQRGSSPTSGSVILTLPANMTPARQQVFLNDTGGVVLVTPDGNVRWISGAMSGGGSNLSLSPVRFRAASAIASGAATFTALAAYITGPFAADTTSTFYTGGPTDNTPGFTLDADGVVLFEGMVKATGAYSGNISWARCTTLFTYAGASYNLIFLPTAASAGIARYGADGTGTPGAVGNYLNFGASMTTGQVASLSNILLLDPNSTTTPKLTPLLPYNSWTSYGSGWRTAGFARTPDGLCIGAGLWLGGTPGAASGAMASIPPSWRPRFTVILASLTQAALSRIDVATNGTGSPNDTGATGDLIIPITGAATNWVSLDGVSWPAYGLANVN